MNLPHGRLGILLLVSGPSGSGKTTLCQRAAKENTAKYAVSATTRPPRDGEVDGISYHFLSKEDFQNKITENAFIEHAEVHGNYYGTLKSEVISHLENGTDIVMDIDVQGAELIRNIQDSLIQQCLVNLLDMPPNEEELEARLRNRKTDSEEVIQLRLKNSIEEMARWNEYSYLLISKDRENDFEQFNSILKAEKMHTNRLK